MIPAKQWVFEEAERQGVAPHAIESRVHRGRYIGHKRVRVPGKGIWVTEGGTYQPVGRGNLKEFVMAEAARYGVTIRAVYSRVLRGNYDGMVIERGKRGTAKVIVPGEFKTHYQRKGNKFFDKI